jgi:hypothetical protein
LIQTLLKCTSVQNAIQIPRQTRPICSKWEHLRQMTGLGTQILWIFEFWTYTK